MMKNAPPPTEQDLNDDEDDGDDDEDDDDDDDPFELKEQAENWLQQQLLTEKTANSSSLDAAAYTHYDASRNNGEIPEEHWYSALKSFGVASWTIRAAAMTNREGHLFFWLPRE